MNTMVFIVFVVEQQADERFMSLGPDKRDFNMKRIIPAAAAVLLLGTSAFAQPPTTVTPRSGPNSPTLTNQASPVGTERASRNSNGGDRAHGVFGPEQSAFVHQLQQAGTPYGQWLTDTWCGTGNCGRSAK